jgi:hypothetical protein
VATETNVKKAAAESDPALEPADYLRSRGWRPLGHPKSLACRWLDPTRPLREECRKEKHLMSGEAARVRAAEALIAAGKDAQPYVGRTVEQVVVTPAALPMGLDEALQTQLYRDWEADAERARARA